MSIDDIKSHIAGIDFNKPVKIVSVPPDGAGPNGNILYQYTRSNTAGTVLRGDYYTSDVNATPDMLGVAEKYNVPNSDRALGLTDEIAKRKQEIVDFDNPVEGLKSTSAPITDSWSFKNGIKVPTPGGGNQIYIPKVQIKK